MRLDIRFWTAIVMIGICGLSVARGWSVAHFALVTMNIDASKNRAEIARAWGTVPGVASKALQELMDMIEASDPMAADRRREDISAFLSVKPLSSFGWLSLSGMQLGTHQPMEQVLESLKLSMLTGPNEGYVMAERGIFAVSLWENLSPDLKSRAAIDLAFARTSMDSAVTEKLRAVLSTKTNRVRNELREALLATGLSPKEIDQRLGS
jgi:hypothetical protein